MTMQQLMDANPYRVNNTYSPVPYYQQPMNSINFKSNSYDVRATLSNTGLICGVAAAAVGVGLGYCLYKKYFK